MSAANVLQLWSRTLKSKSVSVKFLCRAGDRYWAVVRMMLQAHTSVHHSAAADDAFRGSNWDIISSLTCWWGDASRSSPGGKYWASSDFWTRTKSSTRTPEGRNQRKMSRQNKKSQSCLFQTSKMYSKLKLWQTIDAPYLHLIYVMKITSELSDFSFSWQPTVPECIVMLIPKSDWRSVVINRLSCCLFTPLKKYGYVNTFDNRITAYGCKGNSSVDFPPSTDPSIGSVHEVFVPVAKHQFDTAVHSQNTMNCVSVICGCVKSDLL